jgi:N-glycosylase/DNA lyase
VGTGPGDSGGTITARDFSLAATMECGQVFGWTKYNDVYFGIIANTAVSLRQVGSSIEFKSGGPAGGPEIAQYLGLNDDLETILAAVGSDPFMRQVLSSVRGLRLLRQEPWHCLCSYLLSSSNRVERIDSLVKEIARRWGKSHTVAGRQVHALPAPGQLARCDEPGIRSCGAGFRSPFLLRAARRIAAGEIDLESIGRMPYEQAKQTLMTLDGVGDKIADCVLLFAFSKFEAFPVDVWIKKAIQQIYFDSRPINNKEIRRFAREHFGRYAGYAQEYIYYYARTRGLEQTANHRRRA